MNNIVSLIDSTGVPVNKSGFLGVVSAGGGDTTQIPINSDNFSQTGSLSGWAIDSSNEKATATWNRNTTVQSIWMNLADYLGEDIGDTWNLRYHMKIASGFSNLTNATGVYLATGLYNQDGSFSSHSATALSGSTMVAEACVSAGGCSYDNPERFYPFIDDATTYEASSSTILPTNTAFWTANGKQAYIEIIRDNGDLTMNMYSDNFETLYTNGSATMSGTYTTDDLTHLILFHNYNYSTGTCDAVANFEIDAVYFNNNSTDAGAPF